MTHLRILILSFVLSCPAWATSIHVPDDQPTIQAGLDTAQSGDTVKVAPGSFSGPGNVDLSFNGRNIVLMSEQGPSATTIDLGGQVRAILFVAGESRAAVVRGFEIKWADHTLGPGGAIVCQGSSPTIEDCVFHSNFIWEDGGAIYCTDGSSPLIAGCVFSGNAALFEANGSGGAVFIGGDSDAVIQDCLFEGNQAGHRGGAVAVGSGVSITNCMFNVNNVGSLHGYSYGGAVDGDAVIRDCVFTTNGVGGNIDEVSSFGGAVAGSGLIERCLFTGNYSYHLGGAVSGSWTIRSTTLGGNYTYLSTGKGGGIYVGDAEVMTLEQSILWGNCASEGAEAYTGEGTLEFVCSAVDSAGVDGAGAVEFFGDQIFTDPIFCDPIPCEFFGGDYTLRDDSPCLPGNSPCGELIGVYGAGCFVVGAAHAASATGFSLHTVAPNPFSGITTIRYDLSEARRIQVSIFDVSGALIRTLLDEEAGMGRHAVTWDGTDATGRRVSSGVYLYRLSTQGESAVGRLILTD